MVYCSGSVSQNSSIKMQLFLLQQKNYDDEDNNNDDDNNDNNDNNDDNSVNDCNVGEDDKDT